MSKDFAAIITDASWVDRDRTGSWAGAVISNFVSGREVFGGKLKGHVPSSNYAELAGVANTLHAALQSQRALRKGMGWLIQNDNVHVIRLLNFHFQQADNKSKPYSPPHTSELENVVVKHIAGLAKTAEPSFILAKHCKGHVAPEQREARHHVQEEMDKLATKHRRNS